MPWVCLVSRAVYPSWQTLEDNLSAATIVVVGSAEPTGPAFGGSNLIEPPSTYLVYILKEVEPLSVEREVWIHGCVPTCRSMYVHIDSGTLDATPPPSVYCYRRSLC